MTAVDLKVFTQLHAEWPWMCAQAGSAQQVRGWLVEAGVLSAGEAPGGLRELLALLQSRAAREGSGFSDLWLGVLLRHAVGGGAGAELAARVVVQAMLPAAVRMTLRSVRAQESLDEVAQVVAVALYQAVRSYPPARPDFRVAQHLRLEMWHHASRDLKREFAPLGTELDEQLAAKLPAEDDPVLAAEDEWLRQASAEAGLSGDLAGARREMVEVLVWALGEQVLSREAAVAIADHYREDTLGDRAAARVVGMSPAALRQQRSRAVSKLRAAAPRWAAAA